MPSRDAWDEMLLGGNDGRLAEIKPTRLVPAQTISRSLIPLAGVLLALTAVSGFEFALTPGGNAMMKTLATNNLPEIEAPALIDFTPKQPDFSFVKNNLSDSLAAVGSAGAIMTTELKREAVLAAQLAVVGYEELGWASLLVGLEVRDDLAQELAAIILFGQNNWVGFSNRVNNSVTTLSSGYSGLSAAATAAADSAVVSLSAVPATSGFMVASAGATLSDWVGTAAGQVEWWLSTGRDFLVAYGQEVGARWRAFFGANDALTTSPSAPVPVSLDQETRNDIKDIKTGVAEILDRLEQGNIQSGVSGPTWPTQGMVVVPKTDNLTPNGLRSRVSGMFSDPVNVSVDESGAAGVITPIFRQGVGDDYLFVLTPVTQ